MDPTNGDDNPGKLNTRVARYQQEFTGNLPLGKRCSIVFNDKHLEQQHI